MRQPPYAGTKHSKLRTDGESLQLAQQPPLADFTFHCVNQPWDRAAGDSSLLLNAITRGLRAAVGRPPAQPLLCLHHPSLGPPECLSVRSPLISFMDVVNHSTHSGAEEKPDLLDLPAWFFQRKIPTLNDFL